MNPALLAGIEERIGAISGQAFVCKRLVPQGGGCIDHGHVLLGGDGRRFFAKTHAADRHDRFEAEADGLRELNSAGAIRVPGPLACGQVAGDAFLILEWLDLGHAGAPDLLGRQLAQLHRHSRADFGWRRGNFIGSTPQSNTPGPDWVAFYGSQRLLPQFELARRKGAPPTLWRAGERLMQRLDAFFPGYRPVPSLLHGDLWGGNHGYVEGVPVLFDPAVYYGDREADLAMTELFGGFPPAFHAAYREAWPLDPGYRVRKRLYNLYHLLNHFNLFAGGYLAQAEAVVADLLAEAG